MTTVHVLALLLALVLNAAANLLMRVGMIRLDAAGGLFKNGPGGAVTTVLTTPVLLIGLTSFALNVVFYMYALQKFKISIAYPLMVGGGYAIMAAVAYLALGERLNAAQKFGVAMILAGVIVVATQIRADVPA